MVPDGSRIAVATASGLVEVLDGRSGKRLWRVAGEERLAWSTTGLLAVHAASDRIVVYDASGRRRAAFAGDTFAWSGRRLASLRNGLLQLRPTGIGTPTVTVRITPKSKGYDGGIAWAGPNVLHVRAGDGVWRGYDFAHHRKLPGYKPFDTVYSPSGQAASIDYSGKQVVKLLRGTTTVARFPQCNDDTPVENVQYVAHTSALVYQTGCAAPSEDIYSVTPAGTSLRRLTHTPVDEFAPSLSPDGSKVAYSVQAVGSFCKGCPHDLWVSGTRLTQHSPDEDAAFDDLPSFSPDGKQIAFVRSGPTRRPRSTRSPSAAAPRRASRCHTGGHRRGARRASPSSRATGRR